MVRESWISATVLDYFISTSVDSCSLIQKYALQTELKINQYTHQRTKEKNKSRNEQKSINYFQFFPFYNQWNTFVICLIDVFTSEKEKRNIRRYKFSCWKLIIVSEPFCISLIVNNYEKWGGIKVLISILEMVFDFSM